MHNLGRNPDDGQAEHENAVAVTSLIEITSPLNTLFVKRERDCQLAKHLPSSRTSTKLPGPAYSLSSRSLTAIAYVIPAVDQVVHEL